MGKHITIHVKPYSGKVDKKKREYHNKIEIANRIEAYLDQRIEADKEPPPEGLPDARVFDYYEIARDVGVDKSIIRELLFRAGGGDNGITIAPKR